MANHTIPAATYIITSAAANNVASLAGGPGSNVICLPLNNPVPNNQKWIVTHVEGVNEGYNFKKAEPDLFASNGDANADGNAHVVGVNVARSYIVTRNADASTYSMSVVNQPGQIWTRVNENAGADVVIGAGLANQQAWIFRLA